MAVRALVVEDEATPLALAAAAVRAVVAAPELTPVPTAPAVVLGLANVRGDVVTVLDAGLLLGNEPVGHAPVVIVLDTAAGVAGLAVPAVPVAAEVEEGQLVDLDRLVRR